MKLKNLFLIGLVAFGFASCSDYLEVDAPSKYDDNYVFNKKSEIERALNGVYAQALNSNTYGNYYLANFCLNSDVDMWVSSNEVATDNSYRRFDSTPLGSENSKAWNAFYMGVEYANNFIYQLENSELYKNTTDEDEKAELDQMLGEAKCLRAMFFHDLVVMYGDIPFSLKPLTEANNKDLLLPITDRTTVHSQLISDLQGIAEKMKHASEVTNGVERCSKEFAWAMIARMALTAGGYSLRPDGTTYGKMERPANYADFYAIAEEYAGKVIESGTHALNNPYNRVFIAQCNYEVINNDDSIFEIPFAKKSSGNVGYLHGPSGAAYEGETVAPNIWGASNGGACLSAFYRFFFDEADKRRDYVIGMWDYTYDGFPNLRNHLTVRNNKWSKFWGPSLGAETSGNTGINYPYMRYADVLLMYAEAANELNNGPTAEAIEALRQVRMRAFGDAAKVDAYLAGVQGSKEDFLKAVLDERRLEFAGENMRWRDLVRNNLYSEVLYYTFLRYYGVGETAGGTSDYTEEVSLYDGFDHDFWSVIPRMVYYTAITSTHTNNNPGNIDIYPNTTLDVPEFYPNTLYKEPTPSDAANAGFTNNTELFAGGNWYNDNEGVPSDYILYSFYGFIRGNLIGDIQVVRNGVLEKADVNNLPVVRYLLPYPNDAILRSEGKYKNQYGY